MTFEPEQGPSPEVVERFIAAFWRINRHLRHGALQQNGEQITRVQWMILRFLRRNESCAIGQLAEHMNVRPSTMSQMLDRLEKEHWVVRVQAPDDSRVRLIRLTDEGRSLIRSIEAVWHERLAMPLSTLTTEEQATLVALLQKLADATKCQQI